MAVIALHDGFHPGEPGLLLQCLVQPLQLRLVEQHLMIYIRQAV